MDRTRTESLGSGGIVDAGRGLVLTNNHVIEGATDILVTLADGRTLNGERVGSDVDTDVAVIRIPARRLEQVPLARPHSLRARVEATPQQLLRTVVRGRSARRVLVQ